MEHSSAKQWLAPSPGSASENLVLSGITHDTTICHTRLPCRAALRFHAKGNIGSRGYAYCSRRGRRGPGRLGQTPFAPKCHGSHHRSCGFLPVTKSIYDCWWKTAQANKETSRTQESTCNPKISSMDWSASSVVVELLDIWGTGSLIERKKESPHRRKTPQPPTSARITSSPTWQGSC